MARHDRDDGVGAGVGIQLTQDFIDVVVPAEDQQFLKARCFLGGVPTVFQIAGPAALVVIRCDCPGDQYEKLILRDLVIRFRVERRYRATGIVMPCNTDQHGIREPVCNLTESSIDSVRAGEYKGAVISLRKNLRVNRRYAGLSCGLYDDLADDLAA